MLEVHGGGGAARGDCLRLRSSMPQDDPAAACIASLHPLPLQVSIPKKTAEKVAEGRAITIE